MGLAKPVHLEMRIHWSLQFECIQSTHLPCVAFSAIKHHKFDQHIGKGLESFHSGNAATRKAEFPTSGHSIPESLHHLHE